MRINNATIRLVLLAAVTWQAAGFVVRPTLVGARLVATHYVPQYQLRLFGTSKDIQLVGKEQMEEILEDFEQGESGYVILDVRNPDEVEKTGKLSPNVITCPLPDLKDALQMDSEKFESTYGSPKPSPDDTIVLTCAAGKRLVLATTLYSCPIA
jgi:rhodanese-related sulfurtransferase